jgi:hypothetical protein
MTLDITRLLAAAALVCSLFAVWIALDGVSSAADGRVGDAAADAAAKKRYPSRPSTKPRPYGVLRLNRKRKFPAKAIPKVARARRADRLGNATRRDLALACRDDTVDLGTWCLQSSTYSTNRDEVGRTDFRFAMRKCVELGGFLPTAAQLAGAASRVKLSSTIDDSRLRASIDEDPSDGLKDRWEMSATLITTAGGSSAAGSQGVTQGSRGNPKTGEPDPPTQPADPAPDTLQYIAVYDNKERGGFAGGRPVGEPGSFRCGFYKVQGDAADAID